MPRKLNVTAPAFLAFVRDEPCCSCRYPAPSDPHHFGHRGLGQKCDDLHTLPLCRRCHDYWHDKQALPGMTRDESLILFWRTQSELHVRWFRKLEAESATPEERAASEVF